VSIAGLTSAANTSEMLLMTADRTPMAMFAAGGPTPACIVSETRVR